MKKEYTIFNNISGINFKFILVSNYKDINEVVNYAWYRVPKHYELSSSIGFWRIKIKKLKHE